MNKVRAAAPQLAGMEPYDPKYLPADAMISANESPIDVPQNVRDEIVREIAAIDLNRYPDPLANELRDMVARANGLTRDQVLFGNGGDELLFDIALAWGGPGRTMLNFPPTFSVYAANARLTGTRVVDVPRAADLKIDQDATLARVAAGDIDYVMLTSPNNPTGCAEPVAFIEKLLDATDALVMVDEAYGEFGGESVLPLLVTHKNLVILHTFSKAYRLAGVRLGYIFADPCVISEFLKVRQPYSVDAVSQAIARCVFKNRDQFVSGIEDTKARRAQLINALAQIDGCDPYPSDANYVLFHVQDAHDVWEQLLARGVLVRDFSSTQYIEDCLRVSVGSDAENKLFTMTLTDILAKRKG